MKFDDKACAILRQAPVDWEPMGKLVRGSTENLRIAGYVEFQAVPGFPGTVLWRITVAGRVALSRDCPS
ncbi:hypothetical protein EN812_05735 [Mesorhizobium sp. M4B.F.Ca.ET.169.01.1.1]|uniref:hypothetical protein n=1 Tax=Mesorhizobium sp. M4B.F.Ca.ET.169.01.1.1 TaxID=2563949 RepID=UPI001093F572|nr:hypothetical protein [Mesorhizobium sp. M4B.F.Ca.ET.169.01.1.1]TGT46840.1 hypothetical protein EN812_05735 [Mesorhizobium sp. M4B.F.Ca.ET.169.01.1.1]